MFKKVPTLIWLLILVTILKEVVFSLVLPIWQTPDEQAHFAQVAYVSEVGQVKRGTPDLNREILESERLLGTERDNSGNNKFTFHPEYKIDYTKSTIGKYEQQIQTLPEEYRTEFVRFEAANYPPLYYWIDSLLYKAFYNQGLIDRVYAARFISILLGVALVFIAWLIGKELFPDNEVFQLTLPLLTSFQPMLSFVESGVNSDNLMNLLFSSFIYLMVLIIKYGIKRQVIIISVVNLLLLYLTKPQFVYAIPIFILALLLARKLKKTELVVGLVLIVIVALLFTLPQLTQLVQNIYPQSFFTTLPKKWADPVGFSRMVLYRTVHETIPWFWGVFDWLGVVLPIEVLRIINRALILVVIGVLIRLVKMVKQRSQDDMLFIFLLMTSLIYFVGIIIFDYIFYSTNGYTFGLQGRYFFPTIIPYMTVILIGLITLVPLRWKNYLSKLIGLLMIALNFIALGVIANTYYNLSSLNNFINQVSQYKPGIFKGNGVIIFMTLYLMALLIFLFNYLRLNSKAVER